MAGFFDQSQLKVFQECPAKWLERYVRKLAPPPGAKGPRDDASAIGSLTHAGLEVYEKFGHVQVPQETIDEINPTPDALAQANTLVAAYTSYSERVPWKYKIFEEPLRGQRLYDNRDGDICKDLLAKVDFAFYVDKPSMIRLVSSEYEGAEVIEPGWYVSEYKTKDISRDRGAWMKEWTMKAQADFQWHCLQRYLNRARPGRPPVVDDPETNIRGILVTVLEYERKRAPIRTCKACHEKLPFSSFLELPDGTWQCVVCGGASKLDPIKVKPETQPLIWKMLIKRTEAQHDAAMRNIINQATTACDVEYNFKHHRMTPTFVDSACISRWGSQCEYYSAHSNWALATAGSEFVQLDTHKYVTQQAQAPGEEPGVEVVEE